MTGQPVVVVTEQRCWQVDGTLFGRQFLGAVAGLEGRVPLTVVSRVAETHESDGQAILPGATWLPYGRLRDGRSRLIGRFRELLKLLLRAPVVIVYCPGVTGAVVGGAALLLRRPVAVVAVGDPKTALGPHVMPGLRGCLTRTLLVTSMRTLIRCARVVRYVTERSIQTEYPPGPRTQVITGTDARLPRIGTERSRPGEPIHLFTAGTMERPYKGFRELIGAVHRVNSELGRKAFTLSVAGTGRLAGELQSQAQELDVDVRFLGQLTPEAMQSMYEVADAFVLASWSEGLPRVILEAMTEGLPVLGSSVGGIPELVQYGWTFPPRDTVALAERLRALLSLDDVGWRALSSHSLETARGCAIASGEAKLAFAEAVSRIIAPSDPGNKVLHIFGQMEVGGAERRTIDLMRSLRQDGVVFDFVALTGKVGSLDSEIESIGGQVHHIGLGLAFPIRFVLLCRQQRYIAVDSHVANFSGAILALARLGGVPVRVAHFRSDSDGHRDTLTRTWRRGLFKALIRCNATDIVGVSPSTLELGYDPSWPKDPRARVIPNGFQVPDLASLDSEPDIWAHAPRPALRLVHVGRDDEGKNRLRAVSVLHALCREGADARLLFVGPEGATGRAAMALAEDLQIGGRVMLSGVRSDVSSVVRHADVLLVTSLREGLPGVVLEALAVGTPVVSSDLPGVRFIAANAYGVSVVSLQESDEEWARVLWLASRAPRAEIADGFKDSPFNLRASRQAHMMLYEGRT